VNPFSWAQFNIFRRDLRAGTNLLVSVSYDQSHPGQGASSAPVISQDGRYVAFISQAVNLVPGTSAGSNCFWRDIDTGITRALTSNAPSVFLPSISGDGRFVAYFSGASQVSVWDAQQGTNIYTTPTGVGSAAISPTGTQLAYEAGSQLYLADVAGNSNRFSFASATPLRPSGQWSGDGRFFAFVTGASLVASDQNGTNDVYLCDTANGALTLVSIDLGLAASAQGVSDSVAINGDGLFVVYRSFATNILRGVTNTPAVYVYSRFTGSNILANLVQPVSTWISWVSTPVLSADGATVGFQTWNAGSITNDLNRAQDVITTLVDSDGDGIPDAWMLQYFGHPNGVAGDRSRAQDDFDGDGMTNLEEFLAGTDPTDANSVFRIQVSLVLSTNGVVVNWPASPSRNYRVQFKNELAEPEWSAAAGAVVVTGGQGHYGAPAEQVSRYYRVVANN
jgi:hypothetical protein